MSTLPLISRLTDRWNDLAISPSYYRSRIFSQRNRNRPEEAEVTSNIEKDSFQVCLDVQQFEPSELNVKVDNKFVIVEGKHKEREDEHGYISRQFVRRYAIPEDYDSERLVSTLSSDGVLTIRCPKPAKIENKPNERIIKIEQADSVKADSQVSSNGAK